MSHHGQHPNILNLVSSVPQRTLISVPLVPNFRPTSSSGTASVQQQLQSLHNLNELRQEQLRQQLSFSNCDQYHNAPYHIIHGRPSTVTPSVPGRPSTDLRAAIKNDSGLHQKLNQSSSQWRTGSATSSSTATSSVLDRKTMSKQMAKGVKRHFERESSPVHSKRSKWEENEKESSSQGSKSVATVQPGPSRSVVVPKHFEQMSSYIWDSFVQTQQTEDMYQKKMRLRDALYTILKGVFPYCGLYMVGSSMNGFGTTQSDLDLCLMLSHKQLDQKKEATEILLIILAALKKCSFIQNLELIRARVPILKFSDSIAEVECDLNVNNAVGIRNTHLLAAYARLDWRLRPLIMFVKSWASFHDINDAKKMTISSYSFTLMVIHFLQCGVSPPVMPALQSKYTDKFRGDLDIRTLSLTDPVPDFNQQNNQTLGELFQGFLRYYAVEFDFDNYGISVRLGKKVAKQFLRKGEVFRKTQWKFICIEEPFDGSNTARSVYDEYTFHRIRRVLSASYHRLQQTRSIDSLLKVPF